MTSTGGPSLGSSPLDSSGPSPAAHAPSASPAADGPNSKSKRIARACQACNRQKLRCDGQQPCGRCVRLRQGEACEYVQSMRGRGRRKRRKVGDGAGGGGVGGKEGGGPAEKRGEDSVKDGMDEEEGEGNEEDEEVPGQWDNWKADQKAGEARPGNTILWGGAKVRPTTSTSGTSSIKGPVALDRLQRAPPPGSGHFSPSRVSGQPRPAKPRSSTAAAPPTRQGGTTPTPSAPLRDRLTTLPLPGDAHNPLAVLAEASATARLGAEEELDELEDSDEDAGGERVGLEGQDQRGHASRPRHGGGIQVAQKPGNAKRKSQTGRGSQSGHSNPRTFSAAPPSAARRPSDHVATNGDDTFYAPLERVLKEEAPHIMRFLDVREAEKLFSLYFAHLHRHLPILDPRHSGPSDVARRNNFLFNAICCVSAAAFEPGMWARLAEFTTFEMERLPREKNIDVVQGHLIYSTWNLGRPRRFERDQTWLRAGLAVRTALDINLHRIALMPGVREGRGAGGPPWLVRSILRTWLVCYITDGTLSAQLGKPGTGDSGEAGSGVARYIRLAQELARERLADAKVAGGSNEEQRRSGEEAGADMWVALWAEWTQILSRATQSFRSDIQQRVRSRTASTTTTIAGTGSDGEDFAAAYPDMCRLLTRQLSDWAQEAEETLLGLGLEPEHAGDLCRRVRMYEGYARLVVTSYGLQQAESIRSGPTGSREGKRRLEEVFASYTSSCIRLVEFFLADSTRTNSSTDPASSTPIHRATSSLLGPGAPDFFATCLTYAAVSLLKCLSVPYAELLGIGSNQDEKRSAILGLARKAAEALAGPTGAPAPTTERATGATGQAAFLSRLIGAASRRQDKRGSSRAQTSSSGMPAGEWHSQSQGAELAQRPLYRGDGPVGSFDPSSELLGRSSSAWHLDAGPSSSMGAENGSSGSHATTHLRDGAELSSRAMTGPTDLGSFVSMMDAGLDPFGVTLGPGFGSGLGSGFGFDLSVQAGATQGQSGVGVYGHLVAERQQHPTQGGLAGGAAYTSRLPEGQFVNGGGTWPGHSTAQVSYGVQPASEQRTLGWEDDALWQAVMHGADRTPTHGMG